MRSCAGSRAVISSSRSGRVRLRGWATTHHKPSHRRSGIVSRLSVHALALSSAVCSAVATMLIQRGLRRSNFYAGFWLNVAVGAVGLWAAVLLLVPRDEYNWHAAPYFIASGVIGTAAGRLFRVAAIEKVGASVSAAILNLAPLISTVLAVALLGERITLAILSGTLVVVLGTTLLSVSGKHVGFRPRELIYPCISAKCFAVVAIPTKLCPGLDGPGFDAAINREHHLDAVGREPRQRLVEEHEARRRRQAARQLHQPELERGEAARQRLGAVGQRHLGERRRSLDPRPVDCGFASEGADHHVLEHGQMREGPDHLECAPDAAAAERARKQARHGLAQKAHLAPIRNEEAVEHVEERRLAGAVGTDDTQDLALADVEAHVRECLQPEKRFRDPLDVEQHATGRGRRRCRGLGHDDRRGAGAVVAASSAGPQPLQHTPVEALGREQDD